MSLCFASLRTDVTELSFTLKKRNDLKQRFYGESCVKNSKAKKGGKYKKLEAERSKNGREKGVRDKNEKYSVEKNLLLRPAFNSGIVMMKAENYSKVVRVLTI